MTFGGGFGIVCSETSATYPPERTMMPNVKFPVTIGGSTIDGRRVDGPPSKKYPVLRDLANAPLTVTIEIDTEVDRYVGVIDRVLPARPMARNLPGEERFVIKTTPPKESGLRPVEHVVSLPAILAFRVIKIEKS